MVNHTLENFLNELGRFPSWRPALFKDLMLEQCKYPKSIFHSHIQNCFERGFAELNENLDLAITDKGIERLFTGFS